MPDFPWFMRNEMNRIASASQYTEGVEGYVFDGADGSQVAFWTCKEDRISVEHAHDFDEYVFVVEGRCTAFVGDGRVELRKGDELVIPKGTRQRMAVAAGTRTLHAFGGRRARRASVEVQPDAGTGADVSVPDAEVE
jgi:mannose-6-phosphate isomerase-like protein (cupin superfamily)